MTTDTIRPRRRGGRGIPASTLLLAVGLAACSSEEPGALPRDDTPVDVTVSAPVKLPGGEHHPATVAASREARIATRISGRIVRIPVDVGSRVAAGQTLAVLDDADVRARVEAAEAGARMARKTYERVRALAREGAASEHELDGARTRMEAAEAEDRAARAQLDYVALAASFPAVVVERMADPGDLAAPGRPILTLAAREGRKVRADLPGRLAGRVEPGEAALIVDPGTGREVPVRIGRVVPSISEASRRFRVEAELPADAGLLPGTVVRFFLERAGEATRWIPADALVRRGQLTGVYVVRDGRLELRWVRTGLVRPGALELLAGPDEPVVRSPAPELYDGRAAGTVRQERWTGPGPGGEEGRR